LARIDGNLSIQGYSSAGTSVAPGRGMNTKLSSLGFVVLTACVTTPLEGELDQEIIGGQQATSTDFPTVVALQQGNGNWFCTGVLVDKDWVLTAASCFDNNNAVQVRIDDSNLTDGTVSGKTIDVAEKHLHPSFNINSNTWIHDVAVLKLAQSVTDRTPTTIHRDPMTVGTSFTQAGFGVNNNNGNGGGVLRSLTTSSIDCAGANDSGISNTNVLCFNAADGNGSCYGDGGAPALIGSGTGREVVGLASGGTGSSCTSGYDIYTALSAELSFIDTYVPHTTPPPSDPPTGNPPPDDPPPPDGDPRDPGSGSDTGGHHAVARGCNAGGGGSAPLLLLAIGAPLFRRRRR